MRYIFTLRPLRYLCLLLWMAVALTACQDKRYHIAVSQCFNDDWHNQLTKDLLFEANTHPELEFSIRQANSSIEQQIEDVEAFLSEGMDLLIISPKDIQKMTPVIEKVFDSGIPVILIDSKMRSGKYTASIGVDNIDIGERAGSFAVYLMGGKGKVIEVMGLSEATTSIDRQKGFKNAIASFPDVVVVDSCFCDWTYQSAYNSFNVLLTRTPDVNLVFAANDIMAQAVYDVCVDHSLKHIPHIIGVDGLTGAGKGISSVLDNKISATCTNPTGGFETVNLALDILKGHPFERNTQLKTTLIYPSNISVVMMQQQQRAAMAKKIEEMSGSLNQSWHRIGQQRLLLLFTGIICLLLVIFIISVRRNHKIQAQLRQKVEETTKSKLNFFTNVSHSFRTPLSLVADPMQQLLKEGNLTPHQEELLQIMSRNANQLIDLSNQVLNVLQADMEKDGEKLDAIAQDAVDRYQRIVEFRNNRLNNGEVHPELLIEAESAPQSDIEERESNSSNASRSSILIIDDNPDIRQYISATLGDSFIVLQAANGKEGLEMAQQNIPDIIVCDVLMPVMDGLDCCRNLKSGEATSHIPVIMLTAYGLDDQRILGYKAGADAYMTKPFNVDVLKARVQNLLESRRRINTSNDPNEEIASSSFGSVDRILVDHFHEFIIKNMSNVDLGIPDLCEEFNMSRVQVYRKFKSLTGQSPVEVIRIIRLKRAKELLETADMTVSEIAFEVGFSSASYFAKCYRDQYNETPTDVQKRVRGNA